MSHFTTIKTQFVSQPHLKQALQDIGPEFGLHKLRENAMVEGYGRITTPAALVMATKNPGYDIGFRKEGEAFSLVADWYGIKDIDQSHLQARLSQRYAYQVVKEKLDQQGFAMVEERLEDQIIHLTLRRTI